MFCPERGLCVGNTYFNHRIHKGGKGTRQSGGKEHDKSLTGEEGYAAICAGCDGGEGNGTIPLRSLYCTV